MLKTCFNFLKPYIEETIFELRPGANDKVPHFVFISTYPDLMLKKTYWLALLTVIVAS